MFGSNDSLADDYLTGYGIQFPGISGKEGKGDAIAESLNVGGCPHSILIAPDKMIALNCCKPDSCNIEEIILNGGVKPKECSTEIISSKPNPLKKYHSDIVFKGIDSQKLVVSILSNGYYGIKIFTSSGRLVTAIATQYSTHNHYEILWNHKKTITPGIFIIEFNTKRQKRAFRAIISK